ncbi:Putative BTB/POZ domain-containing protein [Septoria linicola]|uniref:BTB/POZ domain-containing protein n=1 Tax=Septoria linicola TaxID=215465 RepID=A0A9Q9B395_9PEZI|nr:Putative BTB/POZ domain-containing protein [Septoria linicola]
MEVYIRPMRSFALHGTGTDLIIRTTTRDFSVHKSIVCLASPWINACVFPSGSNDQTLDQFVAPTSVLVLPEKAEEIKTLLEYTYHCKVAAFEHCSDRALKSPELRIAMLQCLDICLLAEKYQYHQLGNAAVQKIIVHLEELNADDLESFAYSLYSRDQDICVGWYRDMQEAVVLQTGITLSTSKETFHVGRMCLSVRYLDDVRQLFHHDPQIMVERLAKIQQVYGCFD